MIYFRGANQDGTSNGNEQFVYNDRSVNLGFFPAILESQSVLKPKFTFNLLASADPGETYWCNPENPHGCADVKIGQYQSWSMGDHKGQTALVQTGTISVLRGTDKYLDTGDDFGVNQHSVGLGQDYDFGDEVGPWSAGCLIRASRDEHDNIFIPTVKNDPREQANPGSYQHWTTIIDQSDFLDMVPAD